MANFLEFAGQRWKQSGYNELAFFLDHSRLRTGRVSFMTTISFVPPWVEEEDLWRAEYRSLQLCIHGGKKQPGSWRAFLGSPIEYVPAEEDEEGRAIGPPIYAPDISLTSLGPGGSSYFVHAKDFCEVKVTLEELPPEDSYELSLKVEGFQPSQRAIEARVQLNMYKWLQALGEALPSEEELEARLEEGRWLHYEDTVHFEQISCTVPLNIADPIRWAQNMARRELGVTEFGMCQVNGGDWQTGKFKPEDGVTEGGRLVLLSPATPSWKEHQRRNAECEKFIAELKKKKNGGKAGD